MTNKTKTEIKAFFETGDKPTQAQFIDLIDSYVDKSGPIGVLETICSGASQGAVVTSANGTPDVISYTQLLSNLGITVYTTALVTNIVSTTYTTTAAASAAAADAIAAAFSTTAQAVAGTNNTTIMNPVLVKNAIAALETGSTITYDNKTTTSGSSVTFSLASTYVGLDFFLIGVSGSSSATITIELSTDGGSSWGTANTLNISNAGNFAGTVTVTHTGVTSTNKRIFASLSLNSTNYSSGSNGFASSFTETSKTGIINAVRFSISSGSFDNGEIIMRAWT